MRGTVTVGKEGPVQRELAREWRGNGGSMAREQGETASPLRH